jgi:hypothetical protein
MTVVSAILHVQQFKTSDLWRHKQCGRINNPQRNVSLLENTFVNVLNSCTESIKNIGSLTFNIIPQIQLYRDCKIWPCRKKFILIFSLYLAYKRISFYIKITTYPLSFKFESQNEDRCSNFAKIFIFLLSNGVFPLLLTENTEQFAWRVEMTWHGDTKNKGIAASSALPPLHTLWFCWLNLTVWFCLLALSSVVYDGAHCSIAGGGEAWHPLLLRHCCRGSRWSTTIAYPPKKNQQKNMGPTAPLIRYSNETTLPCSSVTLRRRWHRFQVPQYM